MSALFSASLTPPSVFSPTPTPTPAPGTASVVDQLVNAQAQPQAAKPIPPQLSSVITAPMSPQSVGRARSLESLHSDDASYGVRVLLEQHYKTVLCDRNTTAAVC